MRGSTARQTTMFAVADPGSPAPDPAHPSLRGVGAGAAGTGFRGDVRQGRPALDPARAALEGERADGALYDSLRAPVLRAAAVQPALLVVSGDEPGGRRL